MPELQLVFNECKGFSYDLQLVIDKCWQRRSSSATPELSIWKRKPVGARRGALVRAHVSFGAWTRFEPSRPSSNSCPRRRQPLTNTCNTRPRPTRPGKHSLLPEDQHLQQHEQPSSRNDPKHMADRRLAFQKVSGRLADET